MSYLIARDGGSDIVTSFGSRMPYLHIVAATSADVKNA
jgi:hypothetical protein